MGGFLYKWIFDGNGGGSRLTDEEVFSWTPDAGPMWAHFDVSETACSDWLAEKSGLPDFAIEELLAGETRPNSVISDKGVLVVLRGVNTAPGSDPEDMVSIRVWIDSSRVISTRRRRLLSAQDVNDALAAGVGPGGVSSFLPALVELLANRIGDFVDGIEESLDDTEETLQSAAVSSARSTLSVTRRQIASVRRFLAPQRDALDRLNRQATPFLTAEDVQDLRQEAERITRYLEDLDLARERAIVLQEEINARVAQEQNNRMYVLSIVAAIFLPLSFITGLFGMNVGGLPGVENPRGFLMTMLLMGAAGAVLVGLFRWKRWF